MAGIILQSIKTKKRVPWVSFLASLSIIGLGQVYNGELLKALALVIVRMLALMMIPLYNLTRETSSALPLFLSLVMIAIVVSLFAAFEAFCQAKQKNDMPVKKYNNKFFYGLFSIFGLFVAFFIMTLLFSFFSIKQNPGNYGPHAQPGDYILTYCKKIYQPGELVMLSDSTIMRIITQDEKNISWNNGFSIDHQALHLGVAENYSQNEHVFIEHNGRNNYFIELHIDFEKIGKKKEFKLQKGKILVATDTRVGDTFIKIIEKKDIQARVEGILFSQNYQRFFMLPTIRK